MAPSPSAPGKAARDILEDAIAERVFPAAVAEAGSSSGALWRVSLGTLTFDPGASATRDRTVFDLASLTKPIVTTTLALRLVARGGLRLDERLADVLPDWCGTDRAHVTVRDVLEHASGLPARLVDRPPITRREFVHDICATPLEAPPRARAIYSDLGFILLGFVIEDRGHVGLDRQFAEAMTGRSGLMFTPAVGDAAPTLPMDGDHRKGRSLVGEVHDTYAALLGGVAGHAGLFGTCAGVGEFARRMLTAARGAVTSGGLLSPALAAKAITRSSVPGSSRALGWDTMLPSSSCGTKMSDSAFGHVGFTGTSLWIDPQRNRYFVLLTNRAAGGGTLEQMRVVRRTFHDVLTDL